LVGSKTKLGGYGVRVGFVQFEPVFGDKELNIQKATLMIDKIDSDLLVFPELCFTGYLFKDKYQLENLAEEIPDGLTTKHFLNLAKKKKLGIVFGLAEKCGNDFYNSACMVTPDGDFFLYRKLHLFMEEKNLFTPGDKKLFVFDFKGTKIGLMICFDWIFPEVMRVLSLKGAQVICHPSNLVFPHCQDAMVTRCIENRVFAITVNRTGKEKRNKKEMSFTGGSQVVDPVGNIITKGSSDHEEVRVVEIDPELAKDKKFTPQNDLWEDRREDFYTDLLTK